MIKRPAAQRSQLNDRAAADHYDVLHAGFGWRVPEFFNIAEACCARWSRLPDAAQRIAVLEDGAGVAPRSYSYAQLQDAANRLSNALLALGVRRGDRVAIVMPQRFETAVAYMAVLQLGAVAMPLSMLFGPEALEFRLHDSEAVAAVCDAAAIARVEAVRGNCPLLRSVLRVGALPADDNRELAALLSQSDPAFTPPATISGLRGWKWRWRSFISSRPRNAPTSTS